MLADLIAKGYFAPFAPRAPDCLAGCGEGELAGLLEVQSVEAGPFVLSWLPKGVDDGETARRAALHDVTVLPLSAYSTEPLARGGLLLGCAAVNAQEMPAAVRQLAVAVRETMRNFAG